MGYIVNDKGAKKVDSENKIINGRKIAEPINPSEQHVVEFKACKSVTWSNNVINESMMSCMVT